jgi:hypothetical protein
MYHRRAARAPEGPLEPSASVGTARLLHALRPLGSIRRLCWDEGHTTWRLRRVATPAVLPAPNPATALLHRSNLVRSEGPVSAMMARLGMGKWYPRP